MIAAIAACPSAAARAVLHSAVARAMRIAVVGTGYVRHLRKLGFHYEGVGRR
jgi:hypothetical protein